MHPKKQSTTRILVECALLVAVASVLCIFPKFKFLPFGGSITICSMLPIVLISYRRGFKWGLLAGLAFAGIQMLTGFEAAGFSVFSILMIVLFDYVVAFTVLGLGGVFRNKLKKPGAELALGSVVVLLLRYLCHVISGYFVWGEYAGWFFGEAGTFGQSVLEHISGNTLAFVYSLVYNATYMLPEMIITGIVALLIGRFALYGIEQQSAHQQNLA